MRSPVAQEKTGVGVGVSYGTNYTTGDRQQGTLSVFNSIFFKSFLLADPYGNPRKQTSCYPFCI